MLTPKYFSVQDVEERGGALFLADEYYYYHRPHSNSNVTERGQYVALPHATSSPQPGAGSTISTVVDYAKYLRAMMAETGPLSAAGRRELLRPRIIADEAAPPPFVGPYGYALGWTHAVMAGEQVWSHAGQVGMFTSFMAMIPNLQRGVVVFQNTDSPAHEVSATM